MQDEWSKRVVNEASKKIKAILGSGTLGQKHSDITLFLGAGYSMLYSGDVSWQVKLPKQTLQGQAESIDAALGQLRTLFEDMLRGASPDTKVFLALKELHNPKD